MHNVEMNFLSEWLNGVAISKISMLLYTTVVISVMKWIVFFLAIAYFIVVCLLFILVQGKAHGSVIYEWKYKQLNIYFSDCFLCRTLILTRRIQILLFWNCGFENWRMLKNTTIEIIVIFLPPVQLHEDPLNREVMWPHTGNVSNRSQTFSLCP